jgi:hypothetical protein
MLCSCFHILWSRPSVFLQDKLANLHTLRLSCAYFAVNTHIHHRARKLAAFLLVQASYIGMTRRHSSNF